MFGNFVIGCGVMVVPGTLNDIARSLQVSVALAGQLIAIAAATMAFGAPLLAGWVAGFDRRRLLALALLWYGAGHGLSALMPSYAALWPVRAATMLGAAVFTPQAAAAIGFMAAPQERGRAITFIFLGWSVASVLGLPMSAWLGETFGWRRGVPGDRRARADRRGLGLPRDARRRAPGGAVAARLEGRADEPGADGDGDGHRAVRAPASSRCSRISRRTTS